MIATQTLQHQSPIDPWLQGSYEGCQRMIADAEREMGAFVSAVREIFGLAAAARAAAYWVELAETVSIPALEGRPNWRKLTIMASSRVAAENTVDRHSAKNELGRRYRRSTS